MTQPLILSRQARQALQAIQVRWQVCLALAVTLCTVACGFGNAGGHGGGHGPLNHLISLAADVMVDSQPDAPNLTFTLGTNATLHFTISNSGNENSDQTITLTVTLPAGISFVSYASVNGNYTCNASGQVIICTSSATVLGLANAVPIINMTVSVANDAQGPTQLPVSVSTPDGANGGTNSGAKGVNFVAAAGSNNLCKPQGSESALKGAWVFLEEGSPSSSGHLGIGGTFVADGNGGITSGSWDVAIPFQVPMVSSTADPTSSNTGSSYSLDNSGRGCLAFASTNPANNNVSIQIFHIVMAGYSNGVATSGYVMDFTPGLAAGSGDGTFAVGLMLPGASNTSNATLNGSYVFGVGGEASGNPASAAGNLTFDGNGGINTAANGLGDSDVAGTLTSAQPITAGTYNLGAGGRGTIKFTVGGVSIDGVMYVSKDTGSVLILSEPSSTAYSVLTGRAISFSGLGATPNTAIAGYQLLTINSAKIATLGIANLAPTNGSATDGTVTGTLWQASGASSQSSALSGTYTVTDAAFGRVTFTGVGNNPPVLYANGGNNGLDGFFVGTNRSADVGRSVFQSASATNYSDSNFPSGFNAVFTQFERDPQTNQYVARLGQITFNGTGGFAGTYDENGPNGLLTNQALNGNYGASSDGSGFFEQNTWPWVTRIDRSFYIDVSANDPNPVVSDVVKQ